MIGSQRAAGPFGTGALPTGALGNETDGSTLATPVFSATAGTALNFYFNFVTSDGGQYADYAWVELFSSGGTPIALLFTARTLPSGSIVPGSGLPSPTATLTPSSVPIIGGAPTWAPLGEWSDACFAAGCGYTGWVNSDYTISSTGNYYLEFGVVNWIDEIYDTGLAIDGVTVGGMPITGGATPEPGTLLLLTGLAPFGLWLRKKLA
ncbi:MAG: NF038132 family protein [Candidatus Acidiferrales bacterium]